MTRRPLPLRRRLAAATGMLLVTALLLLGAYGLGRLALAVLAMAGRAIGARP